MLESLNGKRRVSIQETAEAEPATPINNKKQRLAKIHVTPSSSITSPFFAYTPSSLKNHAALSSIEPKAQHSNLDTTLTPVLSRRTPSSIEPKSHAKNHVPPSSAVTLPSFVSPTPYNVASQKNHETPSSIQPKVRSSQDTATSMKNRVTPSSAVTVPSFVSSTPYNPASQMINVTPVSVESKAHLTIDTTSQKNHVTPASVKLKAQPICLNTTISQKNHVTPSSIKPKPEACNSLDSTMKTVLSRRSSGGESKRLPHSLARLAQRFHQVVTVSEKDTTSCCSLPCIRLTIPLDRPLEVMILIFKSWSTNWVSASVVSTMSSTF
jgi:hypothetical protein